MNKKGIIYIILSSLFFAVMAACVKALPDMPLTEKIFFRNFVGLIAISITLFKQKSSIKINNTLLMILRAVFGLLGVALYYASINVLPMADAVILNKLSPVFVVIFAAIFLNEKLSKSSFFSLALSLVGAFIIIRPTLKVAPIAVLVAISAAAFAGAAYTTIRKLTQTDKPTVIIFYFCFISSIILLPLMVIEGFMMPSLSEAILLFGNGFSALIAQYFMTTAYKYAPASELTIYTYINIVFSIIIGVFIWSEFPDGLSIIGGIIIVLSGYINYRSKNN